MTVVDTIPVYLFQTGETEFLALSSDKTGANLPSKPEPWLLRGNLLDVELGEDVGSALLEVSEYGYCLLREER